MFGKMTVHVAYSHDRSLYHKISCLLLPKYRTTPIEIYMVSNKSILKNNQTKILNLIQATKCISCQLPDLSYIFEG